MGQFDVYRNDNASSRRSVPYLLDVQTDFLELLATRVVVPLVLASEMRAAQRLNPCFEIEGMRVVMSTAELAGVPRRLLKDRVLSLQDHRDEIMAALDFLFIGF